MSRYDIWRDGQHVEVMESEDGRLMNAVAAKWGPGAYRIVMQEESDESDDEDAQP